MYENKTELTSVIREIDPKIKKSLYQTSKQYREDLQQDLYVTIITIIKYQKVKTPKI
ncbi:hypothetical protein ACE1TF_09995 [Geomicrobium sp. JSM 1781026]|uniref:hypothetical protein n=1 Tax=Geomicrobium sp. JSM 1781026 TaxID=3344580 RepID=UPI0035BF082B